MDLSPIGCAYFTDVIILLASIRLICESVLNKKISKIGEARCESGAGLMDVISLCSCEISFCGDS